MTLGAGFKRHLAAVLAAAVRRRHLAGGALEGAGPLKEASAGRGAAPSGIILRMPPVATARCGGNHPDNVAGSGGTCTRGLKLTQRQALSWPWRARPGS